MPPARRPPVRLRSYVLAFGLIAGFLLLSHAPLLHLPFYWDEIGQFIPASLDLFRLGAWIPVSTLPNVHPPGVMAYLAASWSIFGYSIVVTRIAMLLVAAFGALCTFLLGIELARGSVGAPAFAALALLSLSPLFFAQSMLAQLDMPAMSLSALALLLFLQNRFRASAIACTVLVLVKETGLAAPLLFGCWLLFERRSRTGQAQALWFVLPLPGLMLWFAALHHATGHWFGDPAFTVYNVEETLRPVHFLLALARRIYYLFIGTGHFIGTITVIWALKRMPLLRDRPWRIAASFVILHILVVSAFGGAVLERYTLPALPVVFIAFAVAAGSLRRRTRRCVLSGLIACLAAGNFINPLYPFPLENNLAFVSFVNLEQSAAAAVELRGGGPVATAFPVADALRNPAFGFVERSINVIELKDFSPPEVQKLKSRSPDMLIVYSRAWDPLHILDKALESARVARFLTTEFGYRPEMRAGEIAATLSMRVARRWNRRGLSMELLTH